MIKARLDFEALIRHALPVWIIVLTGITITGKLLGLTPHLTIEMMGAWLLLGLVYWFVTHRSTERYRASGS